MSLASALVATALLFAAIGVVLGITGYDDWNSRWRAVAAKYAMLSLFGLAAILVFSSIWISVEW